MGGEGPTIRDLANHFLSHKRSLLNTGELNDRTFQDYHATCTDWSRSWDDAGLLMISSLKTSYVIPITRFGAEYNTLFQSTPG